MVSGFGQFIDPDFFWLAALLGIGYPVLLITNLIAIAAWFFVQRKLIWLPLVCILLTSFNIPRLIQISTADAPENAMKVMSFNVRLFDLYNWTNNVDTRNKIFDLIKESNPDVLCLQEFYQTDVDDENFKTLDTLTTFISAKNHHVHYTTRLYEKKHNWGIVTFSKYPIVGRYMITFENSANNACIVTDIVKGNDTIRVFNTHLASLHFGKQEYEFLESPNNTADHSDRLKKTLRIASLLKKGFIQRSAQIRKIKEAIEASPYECLLCGDFNDTPTSFAYNEIADVMDDAFVEAGCGLGRTYIGKVPSFRIDYIFHSEGLEAYQFKTHDKELSDHRAISCMISKDS